MAKFDSRPGRTHLIRAAKVVLLGLALGHCRVLANRSQVKEVAVGPTLADQIRHAERYRDQRFFRNSDGLQMLTVDVGSDFGPKLAKLSKIITALQKIRNVYESDNFAFTVEKAARIKQIANSDDYSGSLDGLNEEYFPPKSVPIANVVTAEANRAAADHAVAAVFKAAQALAAGNSADGAAAVAGAKAYLRFITADFDAAKQWTISYRLLNNLSDFLNSIDAQAAFDSPRAALLVNILHEVNLLAINQRSGAAVSDERAQEVGDWLFMHPFLTSIQTKANRDLADPQVWQALYNSAHSFETKVASLQRYVQQQMVNAVVDINVSDVRISLSGDKRYSQYSLLVGNAGSASWVGYSEGQLPADSTTTTSVATAGRDWAFSSDAQRPLRRWYEWTAKAQDEKNIKNRQLVLVKLTESLRLMDNPKFLVQLQYLALELQVDPAKVLPTAPSDAVRSNDGVVESAQMDIDGTLYAPGSAKPIPPAPLLPNDVQTDASDAAPASASADDTQPSESDPVDESSAREAGTSSGKR